MKPRPYPLAMPLLLLAALPAFAGTPINRTVAANPGENISISNVAGSVDVTTWNRNEVHIGGTLGSGVKELAVNNASGAVDIRVVYPHDSLHNVEGSHLVVQLPATSPLQVNTVSANISARGLAGPVRLQSVSGNIELHSKSANLHAESVSGDIAIDGSARGARVSAHNIDGGMRIRGVGGEIDAQSVSGNIDLDASWPVTGARVDTTSGNITLSGALAASGDYDVHSTSGDVTLQLPQVPQASFDATTFSGDITTNFGPGPRRKSEFGPGREWQFTHGAGSGQVNIATLSGDIHISAARH